MNGTGINLLDTDDSLDLQPVEDMIDLGSSRIPPATKRAVIVEKSQGSSNKMIALRYDMSEGSVARIWANFVQSTVDVRRLGDENPEVFKKKIRVKAISAIENGLDCDRDPYRQAAVGIQVMKGIGEFKNDDGGQGAKVNILIQALPAEWKSRYIGG